MLTQPLDLQSKLSPPPRDFDGFFWLNVAGVCLFFALLGSRFILAPGLLVGVREGQGFEPPTMREPMHGAATVVVSYRRDNMILFEGGIYEFSNFRSVLERYARAHPRASLLVRFDRQVSMQGFTELCDLARAAGFATVLLATEPTGPEAPEMVPTRR
jgi:hypothetical protein